LYVVSVSHVGVFCNLQPFRDYLGWKVLFQLWRHLMLLHIWRHSALPFQMELRLWLIAVAEGIRMFKLLSATCINLKVGVMFCYISALLWDDWVSSIAQQLLQWFSFLLRLLWRVWGQFLVKELICENNWSGNISLCGSCQHVI